MHARGVGGSLPVLFFGSQIGEWAADRAFQLASRRHRGAHPTALSPPPRMNESIDRPFDRKRDWAALSYCPINEHSLVEQSKAPTDPRSRAYGIVERAANRLESFSVDHGPAGSRFFRFERGNGQTNLWALGFLRKGNRSGGLDQSSRSDRSNSVNGKK